VKEGGTEVDAVQNALRLFNSFQPECITKKHNNVTGVHRDDLDQTRGKRTGKM